MTESWSLSVIKTIFICFAVGGLQRKIFLKIRCRVDYSARVSRYALAMPTVTASPGVVVLQRDMGIDSNETGGINKIKYQRRQQVIE